MTPNDRMAGLTHGDCSTAMGRHVTEMEDMG